jgi:hypothetical protein
MADRESSFGYAVFSSPGFDRVFFSLTPVGSRRQASSLVSSSCAGSITPSSLVRAACSPIRKRMANRTSYSVKSFYQFRKSDNMANVSAALKCVISLVVVFGILYVLISPLPEVDATFSGKSALSYFILITHSLLGSFFLTFSVRFRPLECIAFAHGNVLNMICVRLC